MNAVELIERKRDGGVLAADEIKWLITSYTNDTVADYQMAAMAMAVFIRGLDPDELAAWKELLAEGEGDEEVEDFLRRITGTAAE